MKLQSIQRKFDYLLHNRFCQFDVLRNYDMILNLLDFNAFYSMRYFVAFKGQINCSSVMDTFRIHVPAGQVKINYKTRGK